MTTNKISRSPDFIGIGFRRCASSWIHACLSEHPEIGKPISGLHFFSKDDNYKKGIVWYEKQFQHYNGKKTIGEFSVSYSYPDVYKKTAERILKQYPEAKIICSIRNPIERAYSDYLRSIKYSELNKKISFEKAISIDINFINRGYYGKILEHYMKYFNDKLIVLLYDNLKTNPLVFLQKLYLFLEVDYNYVPSILSKKKGSAFVPRSLTVQKTINFFHKTLFRLLGGKNLVLFKSLTNNFGIRSLIKKINYRVIPPIRQDTRRMLNNVYRDDIEKLSFLLGRDLTFWMDAIH